MSRVVEANMVIAWRADEPAVGEGSDARADLGGSRLETTEPVETDSEPDGAGEAVDGRESDSDGQKTAKRRTKAKKQRDPSAERRERVLGVFDGAIQTPAPGTAGQSNPTVLVIDIDDERALPVLRDAGEVLLALDDGSARDATGEDSARRFWLPEADIPEEHRRRRDEAWDAIEPYVRDGTIYDPRRWARIVADAKERTGKTGPTIRLYLRRCLQGGMVANALLPRFAECGGKGQERCEREIPLGRPSALVKEYERRGNDDPVRAATDDEVRRRIRLGLDNHYFGRTTKGTKVKIRMNSLQRAYDLTCGKEFARVVVRDGSVEFVELPRAELPTYWQFQYEYIKYKRERGPEDTLVSHEGTRSFDLKYRPVLSDPTQLAQGPGAVYLIDACLADVYLVSSIIPGKLIGRPIVYIVIDRFSHMVTGVGVGLEGPSWVGAMLALSNTATDKVDFCREYKLDIGADDWPAHHLPQVLLADRGELEGLNANHLVRSLGIRVDNTAPYRADWKGLVERHFGLLKERTRFIPGAVPDLAERRQRGGRQFELDACLTLHEFRQLLLLCVLEYNTSTTMSGYELDRHMIADGVEPIPVDIWRWGIRNRSGALRTLPLDSVRLNLLPRAEASVTREGIKFKGLLYSCDLAIREGWFVRARAAHRWGVTIAYDPRLMDTVYLDREDGTVQRCDLLPRKDAYLNTDYQELEDLWEVRKWKHEEQRPGRMATRIGYDHQKDAIVEDARARQAGLTSGQSDRERLADRHQTRAVEREAEAERDAPTYITGPRSSEDSATDPGEEGGTFVSGSDGSPDDAQGDGKRMHIPRRRDLGVLSSLRDEREHEGTDN